MYDYNTCRRDETAVNASAVRPKPRAVSELQEDVGLRIETLRASSDPLSTRMCAALLLYVHTRLVGVVYSTS